VRSMVLAGWLVGVTLVGCSRHDKLEAASLVASVDRFRMMNKDDQPGQAKIIADTTCHDPEVCNARTACVDSSAAIAQALLIMNENEHTLADLKAHRTGLEDEVVKNIPKKLDQAAALLTHGYTQLENCVQKTDGLRRRFSL
jgi:hypothetical protein